MSTYTISNKDISLNDIERIISQKKKLKLSQQSIDLVNKCRAYLDYKMKRVGAPVYGINTGFGSLCDTVISDDDLGKLQENLVKSHACGSGVEVPEHIVKLMLLLKIKGLSKGYSGVHINTINLLIEFYNKDILPVVYTQGSLGASGDLAPLAHLSLPLLGLGEVRYKHKKIAAKDVLDKFNLIPLKLQSKEGLALLNGTQFMSAYGISILLKSRHLNEFADIIAAMSLDAFDGKYEPFNVLLHHIRNHKGQAKTAKNILEFTKESEIGKQKKIHVQDPYCFRCIPQVHGATKDIIAYAETVFTTEINSVTDNPTVFPDDDLILSGGNFHGQTLAITLDMICIAMAELASISERRIYQLISGQRNLPPFLVANPGLNSGFMIPQYTAASIVSANKQLCTPASVDSIVSSNGQEDHVSMGANAAVKCYNVIENVTTVLGIELLNAAQALEFKHSPKSSPFIENIHARFREEIPFVKEDVIMYPLIERSRNFIIDYKF